jgi:hypothetical protein
MEAQAVMEVLVRKATPAELALMVFQGVTEEEEALVALEVYVV